MQVFCSNPYFNEPGYQATEGTASGTQRSRAYNANVMYNTLLHAIIPPLANIHAKPHGVFADVLAMHWWFKRDAIMANFNALTQASSAQVTTATNLLRALAPP